MVYRLVPMQNTVRQAMVFDLTTFAIQSVKHRKGGALREDGAAGHEAQFGRVRPRAFHRALGERVRAGRRHDVPTSEGHRIEPTLGIACLA